MGSRFGGLKQITPVDSFGHAIIDFSLYDAYRAGFRDVAFIIKHEIEEDFKNFIGRRIEKYFNVKYIFQELTNLPEGFSVPEGRVKPWGTGHAVMCCRGQVDGPFAVINADDFYGPSAYTALYNFLADPSRANNEHAMVAYLLRNTVTENGSVARGICTNVNGYLTDVVERTNIVKRGNDGAFSEDGGQTWTDLPGDTLVSMNCWAFGNSLLGELYDGFAPWLEKNVPVNPLKCEYFLPFKVNDMIKENKASVALLNCTETWYGITYKDDMETVVSAIARLREKGIYPDTLLD